MSQSNYLNEPCFKNGLIFGDPAQIRYVQRKADELAHEDEQRKKGLNLYMVDITEERSYGIEIWADGEFSAIEKANMQMEDDIDNDWSDSRREYEIVNLTEVPN
jgi:hypothetical protein